MFLNEYHTGCYALELNTANKNVYMQHKVIYCLGLYYVSVQVRASL